MKPLNRRVLPVWFALLSALLAATPAAAAITDYPFRIVTRGTSAAYEVVAENAGPAPITVHVQARWIPVASDRAWPVTATVPPHTSLPLGRIHADQGAAAAHNADFIYSYHFGRPGIVEAGNVSYRLPFANGLGFEVSQAHGGQLSTHDNRATQYAIDFAMPAGSAVLAARDGVVVDVTLRYTEGGYDPRLIDRANTVAIAHDDGTVAEYAHLSPGTAAIMIGERVSAGALLGRSGSTGYSSEPHLHFSVTRPEVRDGRVVRVSLPMIFYTDEPSTRFSVQMGTTVWANYGAGARYAAARPAQEQWP